MWRAYTLVAVVFALGLAIGALGILTADAYDAATKPTPNYLRIDCSDLHLRLCYPNDADCVMYPNNAETYHQETGK